MYMVKGEKHNRLTSLEDVETGHGKALFECECGERKEIISFDVKRGHSTSCGCKNIERCTIHGYYRHEAYTCWGSMIKRCYDVRTNGYERYGGKGIQVCKEWKDSPKIFCDWALEHGFQKGLQIDRIDNNKNYYPENCRFITSKENNRNRNNNHLLTAFGETKCLAEWEEDERCLVDYECLRMRLKHGWSSKKAITTQSQRDKNLTTAFQETKSITEWAKDSRCKVGFACLCSRINEYNWDAERAITTPSRRKNK